MNVRWRLVFGIMAAAMGPWGGWGTSPAAGQDSRPATAPAGEPESGGDPDAEFAPRLTVEEAIRKAYELIVVAEAKGEGATAALKETDKLLGFVRARDPLNADADFLFGRTYLLLNRPREAMQHIDRYVATQKGANDWLAFRFLGDLCLDGKYSAMAADKYRKATELSPSEPAPQAGLAKAELQLGRPAVAQEYARKAVNLDSVKPPADRDPRYPAVLAEALLGEVRQRGKGKIEEAYEAAKHAVDLGRMKVVNDPSDPKLLDTLDSHYGLLERVIREIIRIYPERSDEYVRLAQVLRERADVNHLLRYHGVLVTIQNVIERAAPNTPPALQFERARLLYAVGDLARARSSVEEVLSKEPDHAEARQLLSEIERSTPASSANR